MTAHYLRSCSLYSDQWFITFLLENCQRMSRIINTLLTVYCITNTLSLAQSDVSPSDASDHREAAPISRSPSQIVPFKCFRGSSPHAKSKPENLRWNFKTSITNFVIDVAWFPRHSLASRHRYPEGWTDKQWVLNIKLPVTLTCIQCLPVSLTTTTVFLCHRVLTPRYQLRYIQWAILHHFYFPLPCYSQT